MNGVAVACPSCRAILPPEAVNTPKTAPCRRCGRLIRVAAFPALAAGYVPGGGGEALMDDAEASCFYHADKRAETVCDQCGRFLCSLCDVRMGDRHVCPACIESRLGGGRKKTSGERRFLHDSLALALATWPVLVWFATPLTAPMAIFVAIRYWNAPGGLFRWRRVRLVAAIVLAGLQVAAWLVVLFVLLFDKLDLVVRSL